MKHVRLYQNTPLKIGDRLSLNAYASHHLAKVLRFPAGKNITLFNGDGMDYIAKVLGVLQYCQVEILAKQQNLSESKLNITLAQGIAKGEKMDFIIQKAVELGVGRIIPFISERCVVRLTGDKIKKRHQHWKKIIINACEQSNRAVVPILDTAISFDEFIKMELDNMIILHHLAEKSLLEFLPLRKTCIIVGPEGGFSEAEIQHCISHNAQPLLLGKRILRTETAALVAMANMHLLWGD